MNVIIKIQYDYPKERTSAHHLLKALEWDIRYKTGHYYLLHKNTTLPLLAIIDLCTMLDQEGFTHQVIGFHQERVTEVPNKEKQ